MKEPTSEQCTENALLREDENFCYFAAWYPQMGGYVGKAEVKIGKNAAGTDGCFDVRVWHSGEFPFDYEGGINPAALHHCSPNQFIDFGKMVLRLQGEKEQEAEDRADALAIQEALKDERRLPLPLPTYTDADRMDWLERNPRLSEFHVNGTVQHSYLYAVAGAPGVKLREILDAVMINDKVQPR